MLFLRRLILVVLSPFIINCSGVINFSQNPSDSRTQDPQALGLAGFADIQGKEFRAVHLFSDPCAGVASPACLAPVSDKDFQLKHTIQFNQSGNTFLISGNSGCNQYAGNFEIIETTGMVSKFKLTLKELSLMACLDQKANEEESEYLGSLANTQILYVDSKTTLRMVSDRFTTVISFIASEAATPVAF